MRLLRFIHEQIIESYQQNEPITEQIHVENLLETELTDEVEHNSLIPGISANY